MAAQETGTSPAPLRALAEAGLLALLVTAGVALASASFGLTGSRVATIFCVNLCAVIAFQVFSGNSGIVSFGHTAFMGAGAYMSAWLTMPGSMLRVTLPNLPGWLGGYELPLAASLGVVAVAGGALAIVSGLAVGRLSGASASIATLGFLIIIYSVLAAARDFTRGNQAFYGIPRVTDVVVATAAACLFILVARLYRESRAGLMLRAVRDNETAAAASGIDPVRMRRIAWVLSGALAAVAGALYGHMLGAFTPKDFYFDLAFSLVAMMIVGGMGTVTGAVGGVGLVMALQEGLQRLETGFVLGPVTLPSMFGLPVVGVSVAILLVLLLRPAGLFGRRELGLPGGLFGRRPARPAPPMPAPAAQPLRLSGVTKAFAGLVALNDVSADIPPGRITGLIGPNGAGKSTLVNSITGLSPVTGGNVALGTRRLHLGPPHAVARAGVARTFQNIRLFERLTTEENVIAAAVAAGLSLSDARAVAARELARIGLTPLADQPAGALPYGARRRLEIARALATGPAFLLLDEPAAGMNPEETADLAARLRGLPGERGVGIVLIDHDLGFVLSLCDRVIVLNRGEVIADAAPSAVQTDPAVLEAYLGTRASRAPIPATAEAIPDPAGKERTHAPS